MGATNTSATTHPVIHRVVLAVLFFTTVESTAGGFQLQLDSMISCIGGTREAIHPFIWFIPPEVPYHDLTKAPYSSTGHEP